MIELSNVAELPRGLYKVYSLDHEGISEGYFIRWKKGGMIFVLEKGK